MQKSGFPYPCDRYAAATFRQWRAFTLQSTQICWVTEKGFGSHMEINTLFNWALTLLTIGFGLFGWLMPDYTMRTIDLRDGGSTMGKSEVRAGLVAF